MKKTDILCILDRSGSMSPFVADTVGGFNTFLAEQKAVPGEARLTLVQFDNEYRVDHDRVPIGDVPDLTATSYVPRGMTALLDAVGRSIDALGAQLSALPDAEKPELVLVFINTDGMENASREYTRDRVREMVTHQREKYGWQFVFAGADDSAFAEAGAIGIPKNMTSAYAATSAGTVARYADTSKSFASLRTGG